MHAKSRGYLERLGDYPSVNSPSVFAVQELWRVEDEGVLQAPLQHSKPLEEDLIFQDGQN